MKYPSISKKNLTANDKKHSLDLGVVVHACDPST